jgi:hypothetical protein
VVSQISPKDGHVVFKAPETSRTSSLDHGQAMAPAFLRQLAQDTSGREAFRAAFRPDSAAQQPKCQHQEKTESGDAKQRAAGRLP